MNIKNLLPSVSTYIRRIFLFSSSSLGFYFLEKATSCHNRLILFEATLVQSSVVMDFIHSGPCLHLGSLFPLCFSPTGLWFVVTLSCSTWPLITPSHLIEDSQEPLANPADERYFTSVCWDLGAIITLESLTRPRRNQLTKSTTHIISEWRFCLRICFFSHVLL